MAGERRLFDQVVPIGPTERQALLQYVQTFCPNRARIDVDQVFLSVDGYPLSVNAIVHIMARLAKASGVSRLHGHLLCHTSGAEGDHSRGDIKWYVA